MNAPGRAGAFLAMIGACIGLIAARAAVGPRAAERRLATPHPVRIDARHYVPSRRHDAAARSAAPRDARRGRHATATGRRETAPAPPVARTSSSPRVGTVAARPAHHGARTPASPTPPHAASRQIIDGTQQQTQFGALQVRVVMQGSEIVEISAPVYPNDDARSRQINAEALPQLRQQVLNAQSANIDGVSGATVTSDAYELSLQAALDKA